MSKFGWRYPAGAGNDPFAPYNNTVGEDPTDATILKQAFPDAKGPYEVYRQAYKYTGCGPSVGFEIETQQEFQDGFGPGVRAARKWLYCDDLHGLGTWDECDSQGIIFVGISVGSIVEGVDVDCQTLTDDLQGEPDIIAERFNKMVADVDSEADYIWRETHGCDDCGSEGEWGHPAINPDCQSCEGEGDIR